MLVQRVYNAKYTPKYTYLKWHYSFLKQPTHVFIHIFLHVSVASNNNHLRKTVNNKVSQGASQRHQSYVALWLFKSSFISLSNYLASQLIDL